MSSEQNALLQLAHENGRNALAFLERGFRQMARDQFKAAIQNIELAELLGIAPTPVREQPAVEVETISLPAPNHEH